MGVDIVPYLLGRCGECLVIGSDLVEDTEVKVCIVR